MGDIYSSGASKSGPPPAPPPPAKTKKLHWRKKQMEEQNLFSAAEHARYAKMKEAKTANAGLKTQTRKYDTRNLSVLKYDPFFAFNCKHVEANICRHQAVYFIFIIHDMCLPTCPAKHAQTAREFLDNTPPKYKEAHASLSAAIDLFADADMFLQRSVCNLHMGKVCKRFLVCECGCE